MPSRLSRRSVVVVAMLSITGCTTDENGDDAAGEDDAGTASTTASTATATATPRTGDPTTTASGVERLPEPSPLADVLVGLVEADDRASYAESRDLDYRDGRVRVEVALEPGGTPPDRYLPEDRTTYEDTVVAYVRVEYLVDLALHDNVRLVTPYIEPQTAST